jgi:cellulose synthase/poly-beta-1,6-N-acetylglucosamine synthase-like glycosyltransferase
MSSPTVSVIIPAYRAAGVIGRAVDSLLAQTRPPDEILIIDDGSPDDVAAALEPYGQRVRLLRQPNGGASSARNRGLDEATGEWIAFLDADDYWEPCKLERQLSLLQAHPEVGLVAGRFFAQTPGQAKRDALPHWRHLFERVLTPRGPDALEVARRVWTSIVLFRRSLLGNHRFDTTLRTAEDVDLWVRLVRTTSVYMIWEPLATCVEEAGSLSRSDVAGDCRNMLRVLARCADLLGPSGLRWWEANVYRQWAAGHLAAGEPRRALGPAWQRWRRQWWSPQANWILLKTLVRSALTPARRASEGVLKGGATPPQPEPGRGEVSSPSSAPSLARRAGCDSAGVP